MYELFFNWAKTSNQTTVKNILKDHVLLTKHIPGLYESSPQLFEILKDLAFIRIGEKYYKANECYDGSDALFEFAYPEKLLPKEYQGYEWRDHLIKLGFNVSCTVNDCLAVANKFASLDRYINKDDIQIYQKLLENINKLNDSQLMAQIKDIKFLPSEFSTTQDSEKGKLLRKIHEPSDMLICLSGSAFGTYKSLVWIQKPILPRFCQILIEENKYFMNLGIDIEPSAETVLSNFLAMIEVLTSEDNLLNQLNTKEVEILDNILQEYYSTFLKVVNNQNLKRDIKMVMVRNKYNKELKFIEPRLLVKNMDQRDQIDRYIYKIPLNCEKYWELFNYLGAKEKISYEQCQEILADYYGEYKDQPLNNELYENVIIVSKLLFHDDVISKTENNHLNIFLPNMLRIMKPLVSLYYKDNAYFELIIDKSDDIRKICLFDENELLKVIERSIKSEVARDEDLNDDQPPPLKRKKLLTMKDKMLWSISWKMIFQQIQINNRNNQKCLNMPRPLSVILREEISVMSSLDGYLNEAKTDE